MPRLHITAEGVTEREFAKHILAPWLTQRQVFADARCVLTSRDKKAHKDYRGGLIRYQKARDDITRWLKEDKDPSRFFTTMCDLYALPTDFPGYKKAVSLTDPYKRVRLLEAEFGADIADSRFIPYIQLLEFEALIFVDPQQLDWSYLDDDSAIAQLVAISEAQEPELINDGPETAPSKRILHVLPEYDKVTAGVETTRQIGIPRLRERCPHFDQWLTKLEALGVAPS
jgi:hypothetical protein